jgi:hypothetical protein
MTGGARITFTPLTLLSTPPRAHLIVCETERKTFERDRRKSSCEKDVGGASRTYDKTAEYVIKPGSMTNENEWRPCQVSSKVASAYHCCRYLNLEAMFSSSKVRADSSASAFESPDMCQAKQCGVRM